MSVCSVAIQKIAGNCRRRGQQPIGGGWSILGNRLTRDDLGEKIQSGDIIDGIGPVRGNAEFLAVLILTRGDVLQGLDNQARIVAIIGGVPIPVAPGADRRQSDSAKVPIGNRWC